MCHCMQKPSFRHILNAEISQFSPRSNWNPPFKISAYRPDTVNMETFAGLNIHCFSLMKFCWIAFAMPWPEVLII